MQPWPAPARTNSGRATRVHIGTRVGRRELENELESGDASSSTHSRRATRVRAYSFRVGRRVLCPGPGLTTAVRPWGRRNRLAKLGKKPRRSMSCRRGPRMLYSKRSNHFYPHCVFSMVAVVGSGSNLLILSIPTILPAGLRPPPSSTSISAWWATAAAE